MRGVLRDFGRWIIILFCGACLTANRNQVLPLFSSRIGICIFESAVAGTNYGFGHFFTQSFSVPYQVMPTIFLVRSLTEIHQLSVPESCLQAVRNRYNACCPIPAN